eukprot:scaffold58_cov256-Pinguiococcus_pyrenoidosus.AAC.10
MRELSLLLASAESLWRLLLSFLMLRDTELRSLAGAVRFVEDEGGVTRRLCLLFVVPPSRCFGGELQQG